MSAATGNMNITSVAGNIASHRGPITGFHVSIFLLIEALFSKPEHIMYCSYVSYIYKQQREY